MGHKRSCRNLHQRVLCLGFPLRVIIVSGLMFKSLIHFEFIFVYGASGASHVALVVKNLPANAGDRWDVSLFLGGEDPLEEGVTTHSSILS